MLSLKKEKRNVLCYGLPHRSREKFRPNQGHNIDFGDLLRPNNWKGLVCFHWRTTPGPFVRNPNPLWEKEIGIMPHKHIFGKFWLESRFLQSALALSFLGQ